MPNTVADTGTLRMAGLARRRAGPAPGGVAPRQRWVLADMGKDIVDTAQAHNTLGLLARLAAPADRPDGRRHSLDKAHVAHVAHKVDIVVVDWLLPALSLNMADTGHRVTDRSAFGLSRLRTAEV